MKKELFAVVATVVTLSLLLVPSVGFAAEEQAATSNSDIDLARQAGQSFVDQVATTNPNLPDWKDAYLATPQLYHDLEGRVNAYMFAIENSEKVVGHVLVGNSSYGYPVFEAGEAAPAGIPTTVEVKAALEKGLGLKVRSDRDIGQPIRLLYLGIDGLYAVYNIEGQPAAINLISGKALEFSELKPFMPSPEQYKANKKRTAESRPGVGPLEVVNYWLTMSYYSEGNRKWCGPCSGVSIGQYYRDVKGYTDLCSPNWYMYDRLYDLMEAGPAVVPWKWGRGWRLMSEECGYNNFDDTWYTQVGGSHYFDHIVPDINGPNNWPHGLCCYVGKEYHWRAIKGFQYDTVSEYHQIICTNSATGDNWEYLDWDNLPALLHDTVRIED